MNYNICKKVENLIPYKPLEGNFDIHLDANESYFNLPNEILDEIINQIKKIDFNRYPNSSSKELIEAFGERYSLKNENIAVGNGSDELISIIIGGLLKKDDTLLTIEPDFSMYKHNAHIYEINHKQYNKSKDFSFDIDNVISFINSNNIDAVIFSNPCNPTALGLSKKNVIKLVSSVNCLVIVDEAYMEFYSQSVLEYVENFDNLIVLKTCSKALGLAGIRLGFCVSNKKITSAINSIRSPYNINSLTQIVGKIVLSHKDYLDNCTKKIVKSKNYLYKQLKLREGENIINVYPSDTNFIIIKCKNSKYIKDNLENNSLSSIAIRQFGDYLRINAGNKEENQKLLKIIDAMI